MQVHSQPLGERRRAAQSKLAVCIAVESRTAGETGGDFYVVAQREDDRVLLAVGDACGRGPDAHALLPRILPRVEELAHSRAPPAFMLAELNASARDALPMDRFVTLAVLELDLARGALTVANAAHVPVLQRTGGSTVRVVGRASGPPLGVASAIQYSEDHASLASGDLVVIVTDGLLEAVDTDLDAMSTLRELVLRAPQQADLAGLSIVERLDRSSAGRPTDDATVVCVELLGDTDMSCGAS